MLSNTLTPHSLKPPTTTPLGTGRLAFEAINGPASWTTLSLPSLASLPKLSGIPLYEFALTSPTAELYVELDDEALAVKTSALLAHKSQFGPDSEIDVNVAWVAEQVAKATGVAHVEKAEAFRVFK